jgi:hypothetical protein
LASATVRAGAFWLKPIIFLFIIPLAKANGNEFFTGKFHYSF